MAIEGVLIIPNKPDLNNHELNISRFFLILHRVPVPKDSFLDTVGLLVTFVWAESQTQLSVILFLSNRVYPAEPKV